MDNTRKSFGQFARTLKPLVSISITRFGEPRIEQGRDAWKNLRRNRGISDRNLDEQIANAFAVEGQLADDTLIRDDANGPEIGTKIDFGRALDLLGAHVVRCADQRADAGFLHRHFCGISDFRDAEVQHLDDFFVIVVAEENVLWLEISMHDASSVRTRDAASLSPLPQPAASRAAAASSRATRSRSSCSARCRASRWSRASSSRRIRSRSPII